MAFDYKKARKAGYSDAEIADHLSTEVGFDTKKAREAGYTDAELASHLVSQYSIKNDSTITDKLGDAASAVADTVKSGVSKLGSALDLVSQVPTNPASLVKQVASDQLAPDDGLTPYDPAATQPVSPEIKTAIESGGLEPKFLGPGERQPDTLSAPEGTEVTPLNIAKGLASSLGQGAELTRQGIRSQFADLTGSEDMAADAQLKASRTRNAIQDSTPAFESDTTSGLYSGVSSFIQQAPALAASVATGNPYIALSSAGLTSEAEAYTRYRERGATTEEALTGAIGEGAIEVLTEFTPMKFIVDKFGKEGAGALIAGFLARDAVPEQIATLTQDALDTAIANPDKTWGDYLAERPEAAYQTLLATVAQAAVVGTASKIAYEATGGDTGAAIRSINEVVGSGQISELSNKNLATLYKDAADVESVAPGSVGVVEIEAEIQRRASQGTLEQAAEVVVQAESPVNAAVAGEVQPEIPAGTMAEAETVAPAAPIVEPEIDPALEQENVFDPAGDVTPEQFTMLDPEQRSAWATTATPKAVVATLKSLPTQQARIEAVNSLAISEAAKAKLNKDLGNDKIEAATFQDINNADQQLLKELEAQTAQPTVELQNDQTENQLLDLDPAENYGAYIQALDATITGSAERTQAVTGQAPFRVNPVNAEQAQAITPLTEAIQETFGSSVVPFSATEADAPDGFALNGKAHVNVANLDKAVAFVVGHEFGHTMEQSDDPADREVAQWLRENLIPMIDEPGQRAYAEKFLTRGMGPDGSALTLEQVNTDPDLRMQLESEMVQDFLGKRMTDRKFLNDLAKRDPSGFVGFVQKWIAALDKMLASLNGKKALGVQDIDKYIKDIKQAKNLASTALIQWRANAKARDAQAVNTTAERVDENAKDVQVESPVDEDGVVGEIQFSKKDEAKFSVLKREKASGRYVGAPDWVGSSTAEVAKLYKKVLGMAVEGESGKFWYEKSSKAVLDLVGGDKAEAEKFVGLLAIYSQGTEVGVNTGFALEAYYQWKAGLPIKTGRFPTEQTKKANMWLKEGKDWGGIKTNNFYVDLMEEINPASVDESHATMDMWMALAYDYGMKVLDQGPKYAFAKTMTELIGKELGWKPHQVQAAIWSSIKTRIEATEKERVALERKNGIQVQNDDGSWTYAKDRVYDHFRLAHKLGVKLKITPEEIAAKGFNYEDALNQRMIQMSWEATPSKTAGSLPGIHTASLEQKTEYLEAVTKALTQDGKNLLAEAVGLHSPPTLFGISAWEGQTGAGAQSFLPAPILGAKGKRATIPVARNLLNDYAALMGLVLKQDAVVWHHAVYDESAARENGSHIIFNRALTEVEVADLYQRVYNTFGTWDIAPGYTANGVKLLNFVEGLDNKAFQKGIGDVIESLPDDFGGGYVEDKRYRSDGEYVGNNWKDNPNGETYKQQLRARRPDLLARAEDLRARVEAVDRKFSDKYNWGAPKLSRKQTESLPARGSEGTESPARQGGAGAVNVTGRHYSNQERQSLDGRSFGTGLSGAERGRVFDAKDSRLKSRLYFYVDEGKGVKPEAGVGKFAHNVDLSNLYDTSTRTLSWTKDPNGDNGASANNFESAVLDAGYSGYYRPAAFGTQGVAILLGDAAIGVKPVKTPAFSRKDEISVVEAPKPGQSFIVYRAGSPSERSLAKRNAGNAEGVVGHVINMQDFDKPSQAGWDDKTATIHAYEVTVAKPFGAYSQIQGGNGRAEYAEDGVGRAAAEYKSKPGRGSAIYSFGKSGFTEKHIGSVPLAEIEKLLGGNNFDYSGSTASADALRKAFEPILTNASGKTPAFSRKQTETAEFKKWTEVSQMVLINETAKNKKTWGRHISADQIKVVSQEKDEAFKAANAGQKLNAAYLQAAQQKDAYDAYLKAVAEKLGLKDKVPGLKGRKRTVEKLIADYNSDVTKLKDMLRGTIETESLTQARELYLALREVTPLADVAGNDKSSLDPSLPAANPAGYRDAKLILDMNGVPAELIIAPAALLRAKDIAHSLYEDARGLMAKADTASPAAFLKLQARIDELNAKMAEIYAPAVERSQSSSASLRVQGTELSRELGVLSGLLSGSNANLRLNVPGESSGNSATGMPSKSKNLVPSGKSESGVLTDIVTTSEKDIIPQGKGLKFSRKQTETPEFKKWFGDSKIVDAVGKPLVVYHGTSSEFNAFSPLKKGSNTGWDNTTHGFFFIADKKLALDFANENNSGGKVSVKEAYLAIENPIDLRKTSIFTDKKQAGDIVEFLTDGGEQLTGNDAVDWLDENIGLGEYDEMFEAFNTKEFNDFLIGKGYDGLISNFGNDTAEYVAFNPTQIKSASDNNGQFDSANPDIRFSRKDLQPTNAEAFGPALERASKATAAADHAALIPVSNTPAALKQVKALRANSLIVGTGATIYLKGINQHNSSAHNAAIPVEILRKLPELLADPIAIYDKGAFDKANPKAKNSTTEKLYLVVLPVKVGGEYVTLAITPDAKFGKATANFVKSVHTRAPKTLNQYAKYQVYEGVTDRQKEEASTSPEQFLDRKPRGSQVGVAEALVAGTDITIRQAKGVDKPRSRNDVLALSKKAPNPPPEETALEGAARVAQDKFNRFRVLQDWVKANGVNLSDTADVFMTETLMSGRIATRKEDFRNETMGPLIKKTQAANISMEDIADFLKMQHAQEANKRAREIQKKPDATAFGVSDKDAKAALAAYRQRPDFAKLEGLANEWRGISTQTKDILLNGGILSPEMSKAWDDTYTFYIPVKGTDEDAAAKTGTGTGKGLNVNGKTKQRLGHELRDEAIIENILRDHERAISLDEKNRVGKALIKFALEVQNEDIITVGQPVLRKVLKQGDTAYMVTYHGSDIASFDSYKDAQAYIAQAVLLAGNKTTGTKLGYAIDKTNDNVRVMLQASPMLAANEVNVYVAGRAVRIQINDEIAARAYTNLGIEHLNSILGASREVNNWLSKVYTGYSPDFILTNPIRDAIQGAITLTGELGGLSTAKIFKNYPLAMKELAKFYTTGKSQIVRDYRANGGSTGGAYLSDLERIGDDIRASYEEYSGVLKTYKMTYEKAISDGKSKKAAHTLASVRSGLTGFKKIPVIGHFLKLMEKLNAMTENALRVATFHTLVQNGMTPQRAAAQAKNLMNFNRKGEKANMAGALYLFYNPNVQGSALIKRAMFDAPHKNQARALAGSMVLAAMAVAALNLGGDDEDKKKWEQTPDYIKDGNIVVIRGDKQITITLPYGYRVFWTLGNVISDAHQGKDLDKLSLRMASSVFGNFSPFGNPLEGQEGPFQLVPTSAKMLLGPTMDEDSFGRQIAPTKYVQTEPDSQNMNRATEGTMYAKVAEKLNSLTGGSAYEKGATDVSPEVLKYWVKSLTGGTGQFAMDAVNLSAAAAQGEGPGALREVPVIRRFVRDIGVSDARSAYWERANEVKEAAGQVGQARKAKDADGFDDLVDRKGELASMAKFTEGMLKLANSKRDAYDAIRQDDTLTLKEKRAMMREIEAEEKAIYDEYIAEFDSAVKQK